MKYKNLSHGSAVRCRARAKTLFYSASCDFSGLGFVLFIPWRLAAERGAEFYI